MVNGFPLFIPASPKGAAPHPGKRVALAGALTLLLAGCTGASEPLPPPGPLACAPRSTQSCYCPNDRYGVQTCDDEGLAFSQCACPSDPPPIIPEPEPEPPLTDCAPALALSPASTHVLPWSLSALSATGGTGAYVFELTVPASGGVVNHLTGSYLAGGAGNTVDTVLITDQGCLGSASVDLHVVLPMTVRPATAAVPLSGDVPIEVTKGSGSFTFALSQNESGATLDTDGVYHAGAAAGTDTVTVTDALTGETTGVNLAVQNSAGIFAEAAHLVIPVGESHYLEVRGGSGHISIASSLSGLTVDENLITATAATRGDVTITDLFTGQQASLTVTAVPSLPLTSIRSGEGLAFISTVAGDINQDGFMDAAVGIGEANTGGFTSGAVFIYEGTSVGLNITPVRIISGTRREERLGSRMLLKDVTGDGLADLIVGAYRSNIDAKYGGAVYLYKGKADAFLEAQPAATWAQGSSWGEFGYDITACDFDGDGREDIAIGGRSLEDRETDVVTTNQGAVFIYLGSASGFSVQPTQRLYGQTLNGSGAWVNQAQVKLGRELESGFLNDDAYCDLITSAVNPVPSSDDDGGLYVYAGRPGTALTPGGVSQAPHLAIRRVTGERKTRLGHSLATGDVNGDAVVDIIVGEPYYDTTGSTNAGAVHVIPGGMALSEIASAWTAIEDTPPVFTGDSGNDYEGYWVGSADRNGDDIADILVGSLNGEVAGGVNNTGTVHILDGQLNALPASPPGQSYAGLSAGDRFGLSAAWLGDVNQDGHDDFLGFGQYDATYGYRVGRALYFSGAPDAAPIGLEYPSLPAGQGLGHAVALVPSPANDGSTLAVAGADQQNAANGYNRGAVTIHRVGSDGQLTPLQVLTQGAQGANWNRFGHGLAGLDDFDGDGRPDLAVIAYQQHRPASFNAALFAGPGDNWSAAPASCSGSDISNTGALLVYRGKADGEFTATPGFVYFPSEKNDELRRVASADVNGDGLSDVLLGSTEWDGAQGNTGGVRVVFGRAGAVGIGTRTEVICDADFTFHGSNKDDKLGESLTSAGDLNGDGCDEFAAGSELSDRGNRNQGEVRIFWGAGGVGCPSAVKVTSLLSGDKDSKAGAALAGGHDVDGDSIPDLVVGGDEHLLDDGTKAGAVWLLSGSYLAGLPSQSANGAQSAPTFEGFGDAAGSARLRLEGQTLMERFGASLFLVPNLESDGRAGVLVGRPGAREMGYPNAGGAWLYRYTLPQGADPGGFAAEPALKLTGEVTGWETELGSALSAASTGAGNLLMVGGYWGKGAGVDAGSAYVFSLPDGP